MTLLASALKLFFRELPEPLITKDVRDELFACANEQDPQRLVSAVSAALKPMNPTSAAVLRYLCLHLSRVAAVGSNRMDAKNLATVFSPNLVHSVTTARRPESIISEMELNNVIVEHLIVHAEKVFPIRKERKI